jgi:probable HAF family extracellular repeat protein
MTTVSPSSRCAGAVALRRRFAWGQLAAPGYDVRVADEHLGAACPGVAHELRQHPRDTNRHGLRAGWLVREGRERAAVFDGDRVIEVGLLNRAPGLLQASRARAINGLGQVVGRAATEDRVFGFVWSQGTGLLDLSDLLEPAHPASATAPVHAWRIADARHIDDEGHILAVGVRDGRWHDVLLTPQPHDLLPATSALSAVEHSLEAFRAHLNDHSAW